MDRLSGIRLSPSLQQDDLDAQDFYSELHGMQKALNATPQMSRIYKSDLDPADWKKLMDMSEQELLDAYGASSVGYDNSGDDPYFTIESSYYLQNITFPIHGRSTFVDLKGRGMLRAISSQDYNQPRTVHIIYEGHKRFYAYESFVDGVDLNDLVHEALNKINTDLTYSKEMDRLSESEIRKVLRTQDIE